jgi:hypothetical protein
LPATNPESRGKASPAAWFLADGFVAENSGLRILYAASIIPPNNSTGVGRSSALSSVVEHYLHTLKRAFLAIF